MVYGVWCMVYGVFIADLNRFNFGNVWCMVYGVWCMVYGFGEGYTDGLIKALERRLCRVPRGEGHARSSVGFSFYYTIYG
ncbi:hypothetical protein T484DRAFT_2849521 [Baffinella frigidus]|nr:hypothetical protein T484DRAFT_2849521 [Cryptophyta sp. CCMP2293]